jgi:putative hydrolase of the HAD superfamily
VAAGVLFDFFGTLTTSVQTSERDAAAAILAEALGAEHRALVDVLNDSFYERASGRWGDMAESLRRVAGACGITPTADQVDTACRIRMENEQAFTRLRPEAEPVLAGLAAAGVPVGVLSDCTHELPVVWPTLPVARHVRAATFSVEEGRHKPDPALFELALDRMGVGPADCLYVGDGGSNELTGATAVGMTAVLLRAPDADGALVHRREEGWSGRVVSSLSEVPALVAALGDPR